MWVQGWLKGWALFLIISFYICLSFNGVLYSAQLTVANIYFVLIQSLLNWPRKNYNSFLCLLSTLMLAYSWSEVYLFFIWGINRFWTPIITINIWMNQTMHVFEDHSLKNHCCVCLAIVAGDVKLLFSKAGQRVLLIEGLKRHYIKLLSEWMSE